MSYCFFSLQAKPVQLGVISDHLRSSGYDRYCYEDHQQTDEGSYSVHASFRESHQSEDSTEFRSIAASCGVLSKVRIIAPAIPAGAWF